jgi:hypothetical protein
LAECLRPTLKGGPIPDEAVGGAQPAPVSAAPAQRLGRFPFWRGREPLLDALVPLYERRAQAAVDVLGGKRPPDHDREA